MSIFTCPKVMKFGKVCGNDLFVEEYATQIIAPQEGSGKSETGKAKLGLGTGVYMYRCTNCGKLQQFFKTSDDDDLDYRPSEL